MLMVRLLDLHQSSPMKIYGDLKLIAERKDLYTGDDFYFGFDSSNHNFLDIISGKQPLAIKHGPILSLYRHNVDGYSYDAYYIDVKTKALLPLINIRAKPLSSDIFEQLLPWSFSGFYEADILDTREPVPEPVTPEKASQESELTPKKMVSNLLELLASSFWPDDSMLSLLPAAVTKLNAFSKDLVLTLVDISALKRNVQVAGKKTGDDDCIAPYNPFFDNQRINIAFLQRVNPSQITVRKINDKYPRVEIIAPRLPKGNRYLAVYERTSPETYKKLTNSLDDPKAIAELLNEHFPEVMKASITTSPRPSV